MVNTHYPRVRGMQKVRLQDLWRNCHQVQSPARSRVEKAIFSNNTLREHPPQDTREIRTLEIEKAKLKFQLKNITYEYRNSRAKKIKISCVMADLIVRIENIDNKIAKIKYI